MYKNYIFLACCLVKYLKLLLKLEINIGCDKVMLLSFVGKCLLSSELAN